MLNLKNNGVLPRLARRAAILFVCVCASMVWAQTPPASPADSGLRFAPGGGRDKGSLAPKAGGPTERIEIQSTDDHIDYVVKTYKLTQANSAEVCDLIRKAIELEGGKVDRIAAGSVVNPKGYEAPECKFEGESFLVVTAPEWMIPYLDQTIQALDQKDFASANTGTGLTYIRPLHRKPSELAELIKSSSASGGETVVADDSRNVLYVEDSPSYFALLMEALKQFDTPASQIEARVRIFEISDSNGRDVGLDWYAWKKAAGGEGLKFNWDNSDHPGSYRMDIQSVTAELSFSPTLATEFLNYLAMNGSANVVTDSRVTLVNGTPGSIRSVTQIPYILRQWSTDGDTAGPHRDSPGAADADGLVKEFEEGVSVEISPTIGKETVEIDVHAMVASHVGYTPLQSVPIISTSEITSRAVLKPSKPAVLGGLTRVSLTEGRSGIPGLKDIPVLQYLFSRETKRQQKSQIIITILPLDGSGEQAPTAATNAMPPSVPAPEME